MNVSATPQDPTGKVVVVTGGARGIGAATAAAFASTGARVAIGDLDVDLARATATRIGSAAAGYELDVTDPVQFAEFLDRVETDLGPIDVLINNAGIMPVVAFVEESVESVQRQLAINIEGVVYGTQEAIRRMTGRGGHVVNIASAAGKIAFPGVATYSATKFAVVGLTEAVALEYATSGIEFTCVMPGIVNTELASGLAEHWLLRNSEPGEIAAAIVDAVRYRHRDVYVPKRLGPINALKAALPRGLSNRVMSLVGADHQILDSAYSTERAEYERRVSAARKA